VSSIDHAARRPVPAGTPIPDARAQRLSSASALAHVRPHRSRSNRRCPVAKSQCLRRTFAQGRADGPLFPARPSVRFRWAANLSYPFIATSGNRQKRNHVGKGIQRTNDGAPARWRLKEATNCVGPTHLTRYRDTSGLKHHAHPECDAYKIQALACSSRSISLARTVYSSASFRSSACVCMSVKALA